MQVPISEKATGDWIMEVDVAPATVVCLAMRSKGNYPMGLFRAGENRPLLLDYLIFWVREGNRWKVVLFLRQGRAIVTRLS